MTNKAKKIIGRPTIMTDPTLQKLKEAFAFGCTDEEACYYAEISKSTLYNYQNENPDFLDEKEALKSRPILLARQSVITGIVDDPSLALKFLERKKKDEFSLRSEITGKDGKDIVTSTEEVAKALQAILDDDEQTDKSDKNSS